MKQGLVRSNTRSVYKTDADDELVAEHAGIQRIARLIEARRMELGKTSGFERQYARVTLFRTRLATASRQNLREEVVRLRWAG